MHKTMCAAVVAVLGFGATAAQSAEGLAGRTIQAKFVGQSCSRDTGECLPGVPFNINMYVSPTGSIYDYTQGRKGNVFQNDVVRSNANGSSSAVSVRGNTLVQSVNTGAGSLVVFITARGGSCSVAMRSSVEAYSQKVMVEYCRVLDKHVER